MTFEMIVNKLSIWQGQVEKLPKEHLALGPRFKIMKRGNFKMCLMQNKAIRRSWLGLPPVH